MNLRPEPHGKPLDLPTFERIVVWMLAGAGAIAATFAALVALTIWGDLGQRPAHAAKWLAAFLAVAALAFGVALFRSRQLRNGVASCWSPRALQVAGVLALAGGLLAMRRDAAAGLLRQLGDAGQAIFFACLFFGAAAFVRGLVAARHTSDAR